MEKTIRVIFAILLATTSSFAGVIPVVSSDVAAAPSYSCAIGGQFDNASFKVVSQTVSVDGDKVEYEAVGGEAIATLKIMVDPKNTEKMILAFQPVGNHRYVAAASDLGAKVMTLSNSLFSQEDSSFTVNCNLNQGEQ